MKKFLVLSALMGFASPIHAATISVSDFSKSAYDGALSAFSNGVSEDFETFDEGNVANGVSSQVGRFWALGGVGSGGTVTNAGFANDGSLLATRDGNVYGRSSTTSALTGDSADDMFLDSNDTWGFWWKVSLGGQMFNKLLLTLSDAADTGATMNIVVDGQLTSFSGQSDGNKKIVEIYLGESVETADVFFFNTRNNALRTNDGFSLDDLAVNAVPLPATGLFLIAGLAGLAAAGRRKS